MPKHPSHKTRFSMDASTFDEICENCGATDEVPGGWGLLAEPCPRPQEEKPMNQREAFQKAIEANRYDQATRLVYADWLEENGFDDEAKEQRDWTPRWQEARDYFENCAKEVNNSADWFEDDDEISKVTADDIIRVATNYEKTGDTERVGGNSGYTAQELTGGQVGDEGKEEMFWEHWQVYTRHEGERNYNGCPFRCCY